MPTRKGKLFVSDLLERKQFSTLARNVAGSRDFNRIETDDHHPNALEDAYGQFESEITPAIERIERSGQFAGHDRIVILNLIGLLALRNPRMRRTWSKVQDRLHRMQLEMMTSTPERWEAVSKRVKDAGYEFDESIPYERIRAFVRSENYEVVTHQNNHIRLEVDVFDSLLPALFDRSWHLYIAPEHGGDVITSDHPVCLISTIPRPPGPFSALGYGMSKTAVVFPLTRRHVLWGTFECIEGTHHIGATAVANLNSRIINMADRQVYSRDEDFRFELEGRTYPGLELLDHWEAQHSDAD